jgi:hypothetical protein
MNMNGLREAAAQRKRPTSGTPQATGGLLNIRSIQQLLSQRIHILRLAKVTSSVIVVIRVARHADPATPRMHPVHDWLTVELVLLQG